MSWRPVVIMVLVIGSILIAFEYGYHSGKANGLNEVNEANQKLINQMEAEKTKLESELGDIDDKYTADMQTMQGQIDAAKREATLYEYQANDKRDCNNLDAKWVHIHDTAARLSGVQRAEAARVDDGEAAAVENNRSGASKKRAIEVITDNYSQCAVYINQLTALQDYVKTISADKKPIN